MLLKNLLFQKKDGILIYNNYFSFILPENIHDYKVCGKSPIQWFCDQYSDLKLQNNAYIKLLKKLVTVTLQTIEYTNKLNAINTEAKNLAHA